MRLFLRAETYPNERRTPLTPYDIRLLISFGFTVYVQSSSSRIFSDSEYVEAGAMLVFVPWYLLHSNLIIGLKKLENIDSLNGHTHVYFAHCYKGQTGSLELLQAFLRSKSHLYDFEYFCRGGLRVVSFGFYAGLAGAALGLKQWYSPLVGPIQPWQSVEAMLQDTVVRSKAPRVAIVGAGRCSKGVQHVLNQVGITYDIIHKDSVVNPYEYDILFNCITLDPAYTSVWVEKDHVKPLLIVDISCDYTKANNPIPVYTESSTWENPVLYVSAFLQVIAIENLPSLLPRDSSIEFSKQFTELLLSYGSECWQENANVFREKIDMLS